MSSATIEMDAARRARLKLFVTMLMTYGYSIAGVALLQPFFATTPAPITLVRISGFLFGLAIQGVAIYIAPKGEKL